MVGLFILFFFFSFFSLHLLFLTFSFSTNFVSTTIFRMTSFLNLTFFPSLFYSFLLLFRFFLYSTLSLQTHTHPHSYIYIGRHMSPGLKKRKRGVLARAFCIPDATQRTHTRTHFPSISCTTRQTHLGDGEREKRRQTGQEKGNVHRGLLS
ncbi:hypothetical protein F5X96DRAFT_637972 [Biscogniauxia mediterranea]|nr:hypothetical protein F5X96DRAFT_637972 [Biscogniauxia mediterranea]